VPRAALDLLQQLAAAPGDQAGDEARVRGVFLDHVVDQLAVDHREQIVEQLHAAAAGILGGLHQREDRLGADRPAEEHRTGHLLRRRVLREELAQGHARRAVDDEADVLVLSDRARDEDARAVELVLQLALRHQDHRCRDVVGRRGQRDEEGCDQGKERFHARLRIGLAGSSCRAPSLRRVART
jgi:hypothetical protein